jgi:lipid-A-disaccharide synthase
VSAEAGGVYVVAVEASGDALGADLVKALRSRRAELAIKGIGLGGLADLGVARPIDLSGLAVFGFIDGIKALPRVQKAVAAVCADIVALQPKVVVLIDSWGFTVRVAAAVRAAAPHIKLVKYVGPQVWATRPGRAKTLASLVDHLICIHDFEPPYYAPFGLPCTVCGHPAIGRHVQGDGRAFRARHGFSGDEPLLVIAPGSRSSELRRVGPYLWRAAAALASTRPALRIAVVPAQTVRTQAIGQVHASGLGALIIDEAEKGDAFAAATVVLATSGTVTTEIALQGGPVVIAYKLGWITWALVRAFFFRSPFAALINVAAGAMVAPEFLQTKLSVANLAQACGRLLDSPDARAAQITAQNSTLERMGRGGPAAQDIAADAVLSELDRAG